ncbi:MAG: segregation and condensation protein A [Saccharofermentanales bacterium]
MSSNSENIAPDIKMEHFEGPLDLLCYLIEKNKINIYDIPIVEITDQYLNYISTIPLIDLDFMSEFLVMASTLLNIKSRLLLPVKQNATAIREDDPREELVMKLLEYRRCKALAKELRERHARYKNCYYKVPETAADLGLKASYTKEEFCVDQFYRACKVLTERNGIRYNDVTNKIKYILRREKISLKEKMKMIWNHLIKKTKVFFNEIFPAGTTSRLDRVVGFLALLELLKMDRINVRQDHAFDVILIECEPGNEKVDDETFEKHFRKEKFEEIAYL